MSELLFYRSCVPGHRRLPGVRFTLDPCGGMNRPKRLIQNVRWQFVGLEAFACL